MINYSVQIRLGNGSITTIVISCRSIAEAQQLGKAYGQVLYVTRAH